MIRARTERGLTLVEVLVSMVLLGILLIPAMQAMQTGILGSVIHRELTSTQFRLSSRLEELLAEPFSNLADAATAAGSSNVASTYSEAAGVPGRLLVYLAFYDGDNADADNDPFTGGETDLVWMRVEAEGTIHTLQTVTSRGL